MPQHCDLHETHEKSIKELKEKLELISGKVSTQKGMWTVALIIAAVVIGGILWVSDRNSEAFQKQVAEIKVMTKETSENTQEIKLNVTAFMATHAARMDQISLRMDRIEDELKEHRQRRER